jgi:hypothetical protein
MSMNVITVEAVLSSAACLLDLQFHDAPAHRIVVSPLPIVTKTSILMKHYWKITFNAVCS